MIHKNDGNRISPAVFGITDSEAPVHKIPVKLTSNEFDIFLLLARAPGKIFSLDEIYREVWQMPDLDSTHTVQVHIGRLRRKLEAPARNTDLSPLHGERAICFPNDNG